jgi:hypothetical protein
MPNNDRRLFTTHRAFFDDAAKYMGTLASNTSDLPPRRDIARAAEHILAARAQGREPERDSWGPIDGLDSLLFVASELGAEPAEVKALGALAAGAAHTAEDNNILAAAEEATNARQH